MMWGNQQRVEGQCTGPQDVQGRAQLRGQGQGQGEGEGQGQGPGCDAMSVGSRRV